MSLLWRYLHNLKFEPLQHEKDFAARASPDGLHRPSGVPIPDGCVVDPRFRKIEAYNYFDFSTRFNVTEHFDLTLTAMNIFDKKPPVVGGTVGTTTSNGGNTYPSTYDALGRRFSVGARMKF